MCLQTVQARVGGAEYSQGWPVLQDKKLQYMVSTGLGLRAFLETQRCRCPELAA